MILNALISNDPQPAAIIMYSDEGMGCGISGQDLTYDALFTMSGSASAVQLLSITNASDGSIGATISGNITGTTKISKTGQQGGSNPAVAMSILYSITGLITILFLVIIATGAVRARRYPERYGPRDGVGGRPAQSRARGLARAVLETIPVVKFGDSGQPKLDPEIELENAERQNTADENDATPTNGSSRHLPTLPESSPRSPTHPAAAGALSTVSGSEEKAEEGDDNGAAAADEEGLGCAICTDNFTLGEDVRVLPCNHKFHPQCVDPWLVNVSGTCPLW